MYLGEIERWVDWPEGNMQLLLAPLDAVDDQAILKSCRITERESLPSDPPGRPTGAVISTHTDYARRQQLIGQKCLRDWRGAGAPRDFATKQPLPCNDRNRDAFMLVQPAADFVILKVQSLSLHLEDEIEAAGKG